MRLSFASLDFCSYRPKILNAVSPCMTSEREWSPWSNRSKLGLSMHMLFFSIGIVWKKGLPRYGIAWEKSEILSRVAVSWGLRNSSKHIILPAMDEKSFHLPSEVSGHSAGWWEICFAPKSIPALNGRLCAQPQLSHPWRKHWAPKHFQAVNSWILLTRASSNIWEQIAATPCSCLHQQPAHKASVLLHNILCKTQIAGAMNSLGGPGTISPIPSSPVTNSPFLPRKPIIISASTFPPTPLSPLLCTVRWIKVSVFPAGNGPFSASLILRRPHKCFTATSSKDWPLLLLIRELRGFPRHFPVKPSPLNEWQATSLGVESKVTQQLLGNRQFVTCAGFGDSATLKTKATFKSQKVYLGHWYPGDNLRDIGDGRQAAGAGGLCSEPGCAKRDGPCMCTWPCTESQVYGFFVCSVIWVLLCWALGVLILECNVRQSPLGLGHIAGILVTECGGGLRAWLS